MPNGCCSAFSAPSELTKHMIAEPTRNFVCVVAAIQSYQKYAVCNQACSKRMQLQKCTFKTSKKSGQDNIPDEPHKLAWVQLMRETRVVKDREESFQKKKKPRFNGLTGKITTPSIPVPRPSIAGATAPTAAELIDVESAVNKEGCAESLVQALEIVTASNAAWLAANNLSCKSPPQRLDMVAEILSTMRAREERDNGLFAGVRRSMAYDQPPAARQRLADARADGDEEEIAQREHSTSFVMKMMPK